MAAAAAILLLLDELDETELLLDGAEPLLLELAALVPLITRHSPSE